MMLPSGDKAHAQLLAVLLGMNVLLAAGLVVAALRRPPVVVVPGVRESQVLLPEEVPDAAAAKFVHLYLAYFEDYTPESIEERSTFAFRFVAPELAEGVRRELLERATYVIRTRESSQLTLAPPDLSPRSGAVERMSGGLLRVTAAGERRTYIASELKTAVRMKYAVTLRPRLPTDQDAFGFEVVGQTIRPEEAPKRIEESARVGGRRD